MSTGTDRALSPQLAALVAAGHITEGQALEAMASAPDPGEFEGFARCMTPGCDSYDVGRPLRLRRETVEQRAPDLANMVIGSTVYLVAIDDADLACPDCAQPCAVQEHAPPRYQRMLVG